MDTPTLLLIGFVVVASGLLIYLLRGYISKGKGSNKEEATEVTPTNLIGKEKIKLISYKEALAASKQFIYNVAKFVMEKFSPSAKATLMELGKKLVDAGMQYFHVVDVFSLSLHKQVEQRKAQQQQKGNKKRGGFSQM